MMISEPVGRAGGRADNVVSNGPTGVLRRAAVRARLARRRDRPIKRQVVVHGSFVARWACVSAVVWLLGASTASAQASSFTPGSVGGLDYHLFVPSAADGSRALPLVVYLHGCQQTAPDAALGTRWNQQAEADGFLVLYPQQSPARRCSRRPCVCSN